MTDPPSPRKPTAY